MNTYNGYHSDVPEGGIPASEIPESRDNIHFIRAYGAPSFRPSAAIRTSVDRGFEHEPLTRSVKYVILQSGPYSRSMLYAPYNADLAFGSR
jgi:hypothetical protein